MLRLLYHPVPENTIFILPVVTLGLGALRVAFLSSQAKYRFASQICILPSLQSKLPCAPILALPYGSVSITLILSAASPVSSLTISMILVTSFSLRPFSVEDTTTLALFSLMKHTQSP